MSTAGDLLRQQLAELGATGGEVAAKLAELGIKGKPRAACECPMAAYLESLGYAFGVVSQARIEACPRHEPRGAMIKTPRAIVEFIAGFDRGSYPELDTSRTNPSVGGAL